MFLSGKVEVVTSNVLQSPSWPGSPVTAHLCYIWPWIYPSCHCLNQVFQSSFMPYHKIWLLTSVIRVPLVGQELNILPEYPSSSPISVVFLFCVVFCIPLFIFFSFSFWHCTVCPIYGFWFPMWYLQHFVMELMWISTTCTCTVVHLELY